MERAKKIVLISTKKSRENATIVTAAFSNNYCGVEGKRIVAAEEYRKR